MNRTSQPNLSTEYSDYSITTTLNYSLNQDACKCARILAKCVCHDSFACAMSVNFTTKKIASWKMFVHLCARNSFVCVCVCVSVHIYVCARVCMHTLSFTTSLALISPFLILLSRIFFCHMRDMCNAHTGNTLKCISHIRVLPAL